MNAYWWCWWLCWRQWRDSFDTFDSRILPFCWQRESPRATASQEKSSNSYNDNNNDNNNNNNDNSDNFLSPPTAHEAHITTVSSDTFQQSDKDTCDIHTAARTVADNVDTLDAGVSIAVSDSTMSTVTSVTAMSTVETVSMSHNVTATSLVSATSTVESVSTSQNVASASSPLTVTVNTLSRVCEASTVPSHNGLDTCRFTETYPVEVICPSVFLYLTETAVGLSFSFYTGFRCCCLNFFTYSCFIQQLLARCIILSGYRSGQLSVVLLSVRPSVR